jgi:hypothetical protein
MSLKRILLALALPLYRSLSRTLLKKGSKGMQDRIEEGFMLKRIAWSVALVGLFCLTFHDARAQSEEKKFEVGGQFSVLRLISRTGTVAVLPCLGPLPCPTVTVFSEGRETEPEFGGRIGYNFSKYVAAEVEGNFFPRDRDLDGGRKTQALFDKFGIFAKARPGFVRFAKGDYRPVGACIATFPPPLACFEPIARTDFAFDLGGVVELYPTKRTIVRFDAGDTVIHAGAHNVVAVQVAAPGSLAPIRLVAIPVPGETTHNFQGSIGFAFRF